jgi:hypothetical protein
MPASRRFPAICLTGMAALEAARRGTVCVVSRRPPNDFAQLMSALRDQDDARLVVCARTGWRCEVLLAISEPIHVPQLADRAHEVPRVVEEYGEDAREERGRQIAQLGGIRELGKGYVVPSQSVRPDAPSYIVDVVEQTCTCPDYELRRAPDGAGERGAGQGALPQPHLHRPRDHRVRDRR